MKVLKRMLKQEKGAITMTVLAAMLFITTVLVVSYFSISNQGSNQNRKVQQISKQYSVTDGELEERYNQLLRQLDNTSYMQINEIKRLGNMMLIKKTNTETVDTDGDRLVIPGGFKLSDEENTDKVEKGLVIQDKDGNEFVWIPVSSEELEKMYVEDDLGWTMLGGNVKTYYKTIGVTLKNRTLNRISPGEEGSPFHKEPDLVPYKLSDGSADNRKKAGFIESDGTASSLETMATKLRDDYKNMIDSIRQNKGFYIGRYELGIDDNNNVQVKKGNSMVNSSWYKLYNDCKAFSNDNIESTMIFECLWDQVCRFIYEKGDKIDLDDSRTYGNYKDSQSPANIVGAGNIQKTGFSEIWKTNNIYDLAGNCWEWTQGASSSGNSRAARGGSVYYGGSEFSVSDRHGMNLYDYGYAYGSSRPILYIK